MRRPQIIVAVLMTLTVATHAAAQGRMMGRVEDADHHPIKGATIRATNANLSSSEWTSTTDDKGRFVLLGLRIGADWKFVAEAPGFLPREGTAGVRSVFGPPLMFTLARDPGPIPGALVKDIQQQLTSANALRDQGRYDQAITLYQSIHERNPKLTSLNLVLGGVYRQKAEQEREVAARRALLVQATAAYNAVLMDDADNPRARTELAAVNATLSELK